MGEAKSLSHSKWECKLCAAAHNLHDVLKMIMCSSNSICLKVWAFDLDGST